MAVCWFNHRPSRWSSPVGFPLPAYIVRHPHASVKPGVWGLLFFGFFPFLPGSVHQQKIEQPLLIGIEHEAFVKAVRFQHRKR